ncbi:hypothetical protein [Vibrio neptunius]|uniref:Uncharacterized protein n=2 Tax=Vibrio neptunius TaxID=170651 RepID=A0ABS2ZXV5_9VIBR|nr:hypothetical protein [Vibrio neptunius]MBN3492472.1 hypothetical protein [Vibrio neptunius]MBN3514969.1 hypothetical protein [Vibrio neptunius]MBN3548771.1 hypothetical protein [Vibrio neptunius]MBN3577097.1 hypothetical protein [Vibrio neptunius]MCH9870762.1 hypothetical protein [Vibrio neptunius]
MFRTQLFLLFSLSCTTAACTSTANMPSDNKAQESAAEDTRAVTVTPTNSPPEPKSKGIDGQVLIDNEPTRQILSSLESVTDTLNILTFGIFAGEHR